MLRLKLAVWTTLPFVALSAGGLSVDTPSPDALCPPLEQTRSVVESRLGTLELEGTWRATYVLVHRVRGDVVTLKLRDPSGRIRLEREFSADGTCPTLAQVIALVLERYFLRPEAHSATAAADTAATTSEPPAAPTTAAALTSSDRGGVETQSVQVRQASAKPPQPMATRRPARLILDAGLWTSSAWVAPNVGAALRVSDSWQLGASGGVDLSSHSQAIANGWGEVRRVPLTLQGRHQWWSASPLRLDLGAELLGLYEHVHTYGLREDGSGSRVVPGLGLRLGAEVAPFRSGFTTFAEFSASVLLSALSSPFEVDARTEFAVPAFVFGLNLGIRRRL